MKKIVLQLILIVILAVNHDSEFQVFAELEDIPEWVKQDVYAIYKVEAFGLEGPVTSKYTVIMVNSTDIIFNIEQTYLGETGYFGGFNFFICERRNYYSSWYF